MINSEHLPSPAEVDLEFNLSESSLATALFSKIGIQKLLYKSSTLIFLKDTVELYVEVPVAF